MVSICKCSMLHTHTHTHVNGYCIVYNTSSSGVGGHDCTYRQAGRQMHTVCTCVQGDYGWKGPCAVLILLSCTRNSLNLLLYNVGYSDCSRHNRQLVNHILSRQ